MIITEKIKKSDNKTEENKAQHNSDRQTAKISALSSGNVNKYGFLCSRWGWGGVVLRIKGTKGEIIKIL